MGAFDYICDGQMTIFDFTEQSQKELHTDDVADGVLFRYLRYGPHTLVPEARNKCKEYLDSVNGELPESFIKLYGEPGKWSQLPCRNCEHKENGLCKSGGHTCHYEYGVLICDAFKQTIDAKPKLEKPICQHSNHSCNKENLWEVAEADGGPCKRVCCRQCDVVGCGAQCNGSGEPKPVEVITYSTEEYAEAIVKHLIGHCRSWGMIEKIDKLRADKTLDNFHGLFCGVTRTYFVPLGEWHFDVKFCKDNTVEIKRCGRDYNDRPLDAKIQLQDVLDKL